MRSARSGLILVALLAICASVVSLHASRAAGSEGLVTKTGWFHVLWGDGPASPHQQTALKYFLVDDQGKWIELNLDSKFAEAFGSPLTFNRQRVQVVGEQSTTGEGPLQGSNVAIDRPLAGETVATEAITGTKPWVTILCRFADSTSSTPIPATYFTGLMSGTNPGMDHYWREASYGNMNLAGSVVVGWYNLPHPRSYYVYDRNNDGSLDFDFDRAVADSTLVADPDVFFPDFYGINFIFNQELDGHSWGGGAVVSKDGLVNRVFGATYMPPSAFGDQWRMAHEMGHGFGLPHSSGPYAATYDSQWDPMSAGGTCSPRDSSYGCVGVHTISYHKDKLGWIPAGRKYLASGPSNATINIERFGQPLSGNNYLMAQIPIDGAANRFYTVEARLFAGYDGQVPGEAIVIHEVNIPRGDRAARVVDSDNNGDPNDAGARWTPGETFSDASHGIHVTVNSMGASSFNVSISLSQPPTYSSLQFSQANYTIVEGVEMAVIPVTRSGSTMAAATVAYATSDGTAAQSTDYTMAAGTLSFSAGETSKDVCVLIVDNAYVDGVRTINLTLSNPAGAAMGNPNVSVLTITDDDTVAATSNPIDQAQFFVRQHYHDFLNRVPDQGGLAYWTTQILQCGTDANCINARRIGVSAAYFAEPEFQRTGSYIYSLYSASYGKRPAYNQFMADRSLVIDGPDLELNKQAFAEAWVQRPEFVARYPGNLKGTEFIDLLLQTAQNTSGADLSELRPVLINDFLTYASRGRIAYLVAENRTFRLAEYNKSFVLMEYFGYLRRDADEGGYQFWLDVVDNRVPNNYRSMVCAFLTSAEYQRRFSAVRTRTDAVCSQVQ